MPKSEGSEPARDGFGVGPSGGVGAAEGWVLATGLAGMAFPRRALATACAPEGVYLVDAVVRTPPASVYAETGIPWWDMAERLRWTICLFERMEERERVRP